MAPTPGPGPRSPPGLRGARRAQGAPRAVRALGLCRPKLLERDPACPRHRPARLACATRVRCAPARGPPPVPAQLSLVMRRQLVRIGESAPSRPGVPAPPFLLPWAALRSLLDHRLLCLRGPQQVGCGRLPCLCGTPSGRVSATLRFLGLRSLLPPCLLGLLLVPVRAARASSARSPQPPAVAAAATGAGAGSSSPKREGRRLTRLTRQGLGLSRGSRSFGSGRACRPRPSRMQSIAPPAQM